MSDRQVYTASHPALSRDRVLWFAVFAPPAAWAVDALASVALHHDYCAALTGRTFHPWSGVGVVITLVGVLMLALSLVGGATAWRAHASIGSDTGFGETDVDRRRFMARAGLLLCALFSYAIVLRLVAPAFVPAGWCGS